MSLRSGQLDYHMVQIFVAGGNAEIQICNCKMPSAPNSIWIFKNVVKPFEKVRSGAYKHIFCFKDALSVLILYIAVKPE